MTVPIWGLIQGCFELCPPNGPFSPFLSHFLATFLTVRPIDTPLALTSFFNLGRGDHYDLGGVSRLFPIFAPKQPLFAFFHNILLSKYLTVHPIDTPLALTSLFNVLLGDRDDLRAVWGLFPKLIV